MADAPRLIAICGLASSGKSTVAQMLCEHGWRRERFAAPLKEMLRSIGLSHAELEGELKEKPCRLLCGRTPRHAMQTLGTEWGRQLIGEDLWVRLWEHRVQTMLQYSNRVVCDDLRYPNEARAVHQLGGVIWRLVRGAQAMQHSSEAWAAHLPADVGMDNGGSLAELRQMVMAQEWARQ